MKVTLLLKMTVSSCLYFDSDILNLFRAKSELISLQFFIAAPILFFSYNNIGMKPAEDNYFHQ